MLVFGAKISIIGEYRLLSTMKKAAWVVRLCLGLDFAKRSFAAIRVSRNREVFENFLGGYNNKIHTGTPAAHACAG